MLYTTLANQSPFIAEAFGYFYSAYNDQLVLEWPVAFHFDLLTIIFREKSLSERKIRYIAANIVQGIAFMHSKQIIHQDISPENILVTLI